MYICCRKYYKSSEVTDSYNSSDVVRDLVAALQNYSQSPDTCKSLNEGPVMYNRCIRHFSDNVQFEMSFISVVVGCNAFLNVWSMVYGMDSRQILVIFCLFYSWHRDDEAAPLRLEGVQYLH